MRAAVLACIAAAGCVGPPPVPELLVPESRAAHERQTRRYEGASPEQMLPVAVITLQDLGFQVTNSDTSLGLIVARHGHQRTFGELAYELLQDSLQAMRNMLTFQWHVRPEESRKKLGPVGLSAAVSIAPAGSGSEVRVSVHRFASRPTGEPIVVWAEELTEPEVYAKFFDLLAQALAREVQRK